MKYFVILLVLIGLTGTVFALEPKTANYFSNPDFEIYDINEQRHTFFIPYSIINSKLNDLTVDCPSRAMVIDIDPAKQDGTLTIVLPRTLLDSRYGPNDDSFFILVDGQEVEYSEIETNTEARVLKIPFLENSSQIEIIVATLISHSDDPLKFTPCGEAGHEESQFYKIISPLKQFKSGVSIDEIQCNDDLVLLQKHNGFPACVKPNSVLDLIKRNWLTTEEVEGYAIDYDGDVKHLPFADICSDEMKILLLTHSNISLPDEEFVMDDVELPFGMNHEDFERCALETSFTKSRWDMVTMENPEPFPAKCKNEPAPMEGNWFYDEETCDWIEREWYEGDQFEKIIQHCTDPESNTTGEISSIKKGGEIKLDSKNCTWMHGGFYNQAWVNQTADPVPLIYDGNVMSPEGNIIRPVK